MVPFLLALALPALADAPPLVRAGGPVGIVALPTGSARAVVAVRAGSAYDPPGRDGLAYVTALAIAKAAGPDVALDFGMEMVTYSVPMEGLAALGAALSRPPDALGTPAVGAPACAELAASAWDLWVFAGHPYGHRPTGRDSTLPTFTWEEIRGFQSARYVRDGVRVGIPAPGTVAAGAAAAGPGAGGGSVGATLDGLPKVLSRSPTPTTLPALGGEGVLVIEAPVSAPCAAVGNRAPGVGTAARRAAAAVARGAWGGAPFEPTRLDGRFLLLRPLDASAGASGAGDLWSEYAALGSEGLDDVAFSRGRAAALEALDAAEELRGAFAVALLGAPTVDAVRAALRYTGREEVNREIAAVIDARTVRVVLVTPDATAYRGSEGNPLPGVQAILKAEELFR